MNRATAQPDRPVEAVVAIRALRLVAGGFGRAKPDETPSEAAAWRQACLEEAQAISNTITERIKAELVDQNRSDEEYSVEAALSLLSLFQIELAETSRDLGDLYFRTINIEDATQSGTGLIAGDGRAQMALTFYREAQLALATAFGLSSPTEAARIRILSNDVALRLNWLREGFAFGGRSYDAPVRPIGYAGAADPSVDPLGFTILTSLEASLERLEKADREMDAYLKDERRDLQGQLTSLVTAQAQSEAYRHGQLQALFAELEHLEGDVGELRVSHALIRQEVQGDADAQQNAHERMNAELQARRTAAEKTLEEELARFADQISNLSALGPLEAVAASSSPTEAAALASEADLPEDAEILSRIYGNCGASSTPMARLALNEAWTQARLEAGGARWASFPKLQDLPEALKAALVEEIGPRAFLNEPIQRLANSFRYLEMVGAGAQSEDLDMTRRRSALLQECWELRKTLQVERAIYLNTRLDLETAHLQRLAELAEDEVKLMRDRLIQTAREGGEEVIGSLTTDMRKLQENIHKATVGRINEKIAQTQALLTEAQQIVDQVIKTGKNVGQVAKAAEAVYAAMTAVPVGTGLSVTFERNTLVALQDSALKMAQFTYETLNDVFKIKAQLHAFEESLKEYKDSLRDLELKAVGRDLENALKDARHSVEENVERIYKETRDALLGDLKQTRARLEQEAEATLNSAIRWSDSQASLVETQLQGVFDNLRALDEQRHALQRQQIYALEQLQYDWERILSFAQEIKAIDEQIEVARNQQTAATVSAQLRQEEILEGIRNVDAIKARRIEEIIEQIKQVREGKAQNAWSGARQLALRFLTPPPNLNEGALEKNIALRRALDEAGDEIFELALALTYLTQKEDSLSLAVQPASFAEAQKLKDDLLRQYADQIESFGRQRASVIALRITPEAAQAFGRVRDENDQMNYPYCLDPQEASQGQRCLRVTTSFQRPSNWTALSEHEAAPQSGRSTGPNCGTAMGLSRILPQDIPQNDARSADVLWPANAWTVSDRGRDYCPGLTPPPLKLWSDAPEAEEAEPSANATAEASRSSMESENLKQPSVMGELVFLLDDLTQRGHRGVLADVIVATSNSAATPSNLPNDLTPIGVSHAGCYAGGSLQEQIIRRPLRTRYEKSESLHKSSVETLRPIDGLNELNISLDHIRYNTAEELFGVGAVGRRALFHGRGLANTFEIRIDGDEIKDEIYVFLIASFVRCSERAATNQAPQPSSGAYASEFDQLLEKEEMDQAPTARALLRLERRLAVFGDASLGDQVEGGDRLALLEQGLALSQSLARPLGREPKTLERGAREMIVRNRQDYLDALPEAPETQRPENLANLFDCSLEGRFNCWLTNRDLEQGASATVDDFKASPVNRPIPIHKFDEIIRMAMGDKTQRGPLLMEIDAKLERLDGARGLLGEAVAFLDRSVTTTRTIHTLEAFAEKRLQFLRDATSMLMTASQSRPAGMNATACADWFLSEPGFWVLQQAGGRLSEELRLLGEVKSFNAYCHVSAPDELNCRKGASGSGTDPSLLASKDPILMCAQELGLRYDDAKNFLEAFSSARAAILE